MKDEQTEKTINGTRREARRGGTERTAVGSLENKRTFNEQHRKQQKKCRFHWN